MTSHQTAEVLFAFIRAADRKQLIELAKIFELAREIRKRLMFNGG